MDVLDTALTIIDIIFCIIDMGLIVYLFFYRFPPEREKKNKFVKFRVKQHRASLKRIKS